MTLPMSCIPLAPACAMMSATMRRVFLVHLFWQESLDYRDFVGFDGCKIVSARIFVLALSVLALLQHFVEYGEDIVITKLSALVYL